MKERCGKCTNCLKFERIQKSVLRAVTPRYFGPAIRDGIVEVWNDAVRDFKCTRRPCVSQANKSD